MSHSAVLSVAILLCTTIQAGAKLDAEADKPYQLEVVLHFAPQANLTAHFKKAVQRDLQVWLQDSFGRLAQVQVVDQHPLLKEVLARGFQTALDGWKSIKPAKVCVVLVDYVDGQYEVRTGQYDGLTGLASPAIRIGRTADRPRVAKVALELVLRDFAPVGTVEKREGDKVNVVLKGSKLAREGMGKYLAKGDVLALAQVLRVGGSQEVPEAFLRVLEDPRDGLCQCRLYARYKDDASQLRAGKDVLGYRCLKLRTFKGPLRIRLVDEHGKAQNQLQIEVSHFGLDVERDKFQPKGFPPHGDGMLTTGELYQDLAFVRVLRASGPEAAKIPVPIIENRITTCQVTSKEDPDRDLLDQLRRQRNRFWDGLLETRQVYGALLQDIKVKMDKKKLEEARDRAQAGRKTLQDDLKNLRVALASLRAEVARVPAARFQSAELRQQFAFFRSTVDQLASQLQDLEQREKELGRSIDTWQDIIKDNRKRQILRTQREQALIRIKEADYETAIRLYEQALAEGGEDAKVRKELETLQAAWKLKPELDPGHANARAFVFTNWPKAGSVRELSELLPEASRAVAVCKKVGDKLTLNKFLRVLEQHRDLLHRTVKGLKKSEDDKRTAELIIQKMVPELEKLYLEASAFVTGKPAAGKEK